MAAFVARIRYPIQTAGYALIALGGLVLLARDVVPVPAEVAAGALVAGFLVIGIAFGLTVAAPVAGGEPLPLASPVRGRWEALNSPTSRIPSHGTHAYGQTYAVDLVFAPSETERPVFGRAGGAFLPPERFPAFGEPLHSPAAATVVRVVDAVRDHRSRSSRLAYAWFFVEALPRELRGARGVLGNHLVLRLEDGSHVVFAHLKRGSARVRPGSRVAAGDVVAACGNTGNSTEPHLHVQRQDVANPLLALGLPWTIEPGGIPADGETTRD